MKKQYVKPATTVVEIELEKVVALSIPEGDTATPDHGDVRENVDNNNNSFWGESIW